MQSIIKKNIPLEFSVFIIVFAFFSNLLSAQTFIHSPHGGLTEISGESIQQNEKKGGYYNEFWNYHVSLETGAEIYLTYSISHFGGVRGAVSGARFSLLNYNGKNYSAARQYDIEKLNFDEETYEFKLHPERGIWFEGKPPEEHKIHFRTTKNGNHLDVNLDFHEMESGFTWGDGVFDIGDNDELGISTQIPFSKVSGFIAIDYDTLEVTGTAFMDHTYQTNVGTRLFGKSFKYLRKDNKGAGFFMIPKKRSSEVVGYAFEVNNGDVILKKPTSVEIRANDKFLNEKIASVIEVCYVEHPCEVLEIEKIEEKISMLGELRGIKKMLAKRFLGGNILEMRGSAKLNNEENVFYSLTKLD